jgi:hypothetical protein
VPDSKPGDVPPLTQSADKLLSGRKSLQKYDPTGTNDPVVRTCDPLGFPRADRYSIMAMAFATMSDRIIVLYPFQQQWREIWIDGRPLPKQRRCVRKRRARPAILRIFSGPLGRGQFSSTPTGLDENN